MAPEPLSLSLSPEGTALTCVTFTTPRIHTYIRSGDRAINAVSVTELARPVSLVGVHTLSRRRKRRVSRIYVSTRTASFQKSEI